MKDLFEGSLGRLNNHGGSRIFTTPNTIHVPQEYEAPTDVPNAAEFVACSLDGRLWLWKRSRRFYIVALKWDEDSQKLAFAKTAILNNINIIGRGIDWILTDNFIIQVSDVNPNVFTANLFADSGNTFLFSALRSKIFSSGIDPFTNSAWGLSDDNGNSEGYGFFYRSAILNSVDKHCSLLPAVGDWNIIGNFLVRRPDNTLPDAHNSMLNIRPLIPLEFYRNNPAYGCGFDNNISITHFNGQLCGRGLYHFGRIYILPAVFDEDGNPQEFYLYISPDYSFSPYKSALSQISKNDWLNMSMLHTENNLYGFIAQKANSLSNGLCYSSDSPMLFDIIADSWLQTADNGSLFIDTFNNSGLLLHDKGAIFLNDDNKSYECNALPQWLAPANIVEAVSNQFVISSADNLTIAAHIQQGFYREALTGKILPLSAMAFSGKRLSLGLNNNSNAKTITVNSIEGNADADNIAWDDVYRPAVSIRYLNSFSSSIENDDFIYPVFCSAYSVLSAVLPYSSYPGESSLIETGDSFVTALSHQGIGYGITSGGDYIWPALKSEAEALIFYVDPDTGIPHDFTMKAAFSSDIPTETYYLPITDRGNVLVTRYYFWHPDAVADIPAGIKIQEGKIGFSYYHYTNGGKNTEVRFHPCADIPDNVIKWSSKNNGKLFLHSVGIPSKFFRPYEKMFPHSLPNGMDASAFAVFSENDSNTNFLCDIPSALYINNDGSRSGSIAECIYLGRCFNFRNSNSPYEQDNTLFKDGLHIVTFYESLNSSQCQFIVLRSELHPEIFDFHF